MMLFTLLSCLGNDEPKFETYNGQEIKYLFGFAYVGSLVDQEFVAKAGETLDIEFGIRDPNGDDFEMWFPSAPAGLNFLKDDTKGTWTVPTNYHQEFATFQVLAVDEHGAAGSLFLNYFLDGVEITTGTRGILSGWINTVSGDVRLRLQYEGCEFLGGSWEDPSSVPLQLDVIEPCENCDLAYEIQGFHFGEIFEEEGISENPNDSGQVPNETPDTGDMEEEEPEEFGCRNLFDLRSFGVAYAKNWNTGYQDTILMYREPIWAPQGIGQVQGTELSFTMEVYTEDSLYEEEEGEFDIPF
jgi:hypothetical protein